MGALPEKQVGTLAEREVDSPLPVSEAAPYVLHTQRLADAIRAVKERDFQHHDSPMLSRIFSRLFRRSHRDNFLTQRRELDRILREPPQAVEGLDALNTHLQKRAFHSFARFEEERFAANDEGPDWGELSLWWMADECHRILGQCVQFRPPHSELERMQQQAATFNLLGRRWAQHGSQYKYMRYGVEAVWEIVCMGAIESAEYAGVDPSPIVRLLASSEIGHDGVIEAILVSFKVATILKKAADGNAEPAALAQVEVAATLKPDLGEQVDKKPKAETPRKRTSPGNARPAIVSALVLHHEYDEGEIGNREPVSVNQLAKVAEVGAGTVSGFFKEEWGDYDTYAAECRRSPPILATKLRKLADGDALPVGRDGDIGEQLDALTSGSGRRRQRPKRD